MGPKFFQTIMGRAFFDHHVPNIIKQLKKIADELERYNDREDAKNESKSVSMEP